MTPRQKRLKADYDKIRSEFDGNKVVTVQPVGTTVPPERYIVTYRVPGLRWDKVNGCTYGSDEHIVEIYLHSGYPREKPRCEMKTFVWHPNFGKDICIGDYWAAGETLVDIIVQIGDMIQYKVFNTRSPVNKDAAKWAEKNKRMFPVGNTNILQPQIDVSVEDKPESKNGDGIEIVLEHPTFDDIEIELK